MEKDSYYVYLIYGRALALPFEFSAVVLLGRTSKDRAEGYAAGFNLKQPLACSLVAPMRKEEMIAEFPELFAMPSWINLDAGVNQT